MRLGRAIASLASCAVAVAGTLPAQAIVLHPAVTLHGAAIDFYAGHLVLDAQGNAALDDGVLHVGADRIILDLSHDRYVAAGHVVILSARSRQTAANGAAIGVDLTTHRGMMVALSPVAASYAIAGDAVAVAAPGSAGPEPLALPDLGGEQPFATASVAIAHLDADVRLSGARVLVPGGRNVYLPSYVYTFSPEVGYSASNVFGNGEEIPIYYGSTRDSVDGMHFIYDPASKVGLGFDHRIIDGDKAYDLFSVSPVNGPDKNADFTWEEQINGHASQMLNGSAATGVGSTWLYAANDSLHRSYLDFTSDTALPFNESSVSWQGAYEPLGSGTIGSLFQYHLRSEFGRVQQYATPTPIYNTTFESGLQAPSLLLDPSSSLTLSSDWSYTEYDLPERFFVATYTAEVQHRWDQELSTTFTDTESPAVTVFPTLDDGGRTYLSAQVGTISYSTGDAFALSLYVRHQAESSAPPGASAQPWFASADVRFRVSPSLAIDVNRSYGFGFFGQRYGSIGFQIFP
jgi:hypothetical protein